MRVPIKMTVFFLLSFFLSHSINAKSLVINETIMQEEIQFKTTSLKHLHIGINELIAAINKLNGSKIEPVKGLGNLKDDSSKITEIGAYLKYNIIGTNDLSGSCKAFDDIISKYYPDRKEYEAFYKKIDKLVKEDNK